MPLLIVAGIIKMRGWGAQDVTHKAIKEHEKQIVAEKKVFEEEWRAKAATSGKQSLIIELQESIRIAKINITSLYWDEGGVVHDPSDPYNDDETNEYYKTKHRAYDKQIAEFERTIKYLHTLP